MKNKFIKSLLLLTLSLGFFTSCDKEDEFDIPKLGEAVLMEDFQSHPNNTDVNLAGWTNFAEQGTSLWKRKQFTDNGITNGYAEFSAFGSGSISNVVWLISPELDLDVYATDGISFKIAQHHLDIDSPSNTLEVYVSDNYDGTNVLSASWTKIDANIPTKSTSWYKFISSNIDLSNYNGKIHVAFKFTGSGTLTNLDGAFQIDDFTFYEQDK
jgi:hypothetical protein